MSVVAFVVMVDLLRCEAKCQTFPGENNGFPSAKKLIETKRTDFIEVSIKLTFISFGDVLSSWSTDL